MAASKKLMKPELKQHLEDFELKINLDESSMLELKQNNPFLNAKDEIAKLKKNNSKKKASGGNSNQDVDMENAGPNGEFIPSGNKRRSRADFESGQAQMMDQ